MEYLLAWRFPLYCFLRLLRTPWQYFYLPSAAKAQAEKDESRISTMVTLSFRYSCYMGILCIGLFTRFGKSLGTIIFHNELSGSFIMVLCWLCPFMYLATTMGSIQRPWKNGYYLPAKYVCHGDPSGICAVCSAAVWYPGIFMGLSGQRTAFSLFMLFFCPAVRWNFTAIWQTAF